MRRPRKGQIWVGVRGIDQNEPTLVTRFFRGRVSYEFPDRPGDALPIGVFQNRFLFVDEDGANVTFHQDELAGKVIA